MPRAAAATTIDAIINNAISDVVARALASINKSIALQVAAELKAAVPRSARVASRRGRKARRPARQELTKWIAGVRARRVPNFVIDATGLDTKKKIVAKFGENAAFEKGKPLPATKGESSKVVTGPVAKAARLVKAKAPVVRKAAAPK
jgi:hypothetical protein